MIAAAKLEPVRLELGRLDSSLERLMLLRDGPQERAPSMGELELGGAIWRLMPQWQTLTRLTLDGRDGSDLSGDGNKPVWPQIVAQLEDRLFEEFDLARLNLLGREAELFSAIDRLRVEGYFRSALIPPLVALALVLGWRSGWLAATLTAIAAVVLCWQAVLRLRESNDALVEAIRLDRAQAPSLAELQVLLDEMPRLAEHAQQEHL